MNWFKKLFGIGDKMETDIYGLPYVKTGILMPEVKSTKGKDISEPVFAMLSTWQQNPKRFKLRVDKSIMSLWNDTQYGAYCGNPTSELKVIDPQGHETFYFGLSLFSESYADGYTTAWNMFTSHRIYPILGSEVNSKPSWMTQDELDLIIETVKPYYLRRVNRYRDIVESRIDRTRKANELKSEIAKQKERDRLTGVYNAG